MVSVGVYVTFLSIVASQKDTHIRLAEERNERHAHQESLRQLTQILEETEAERESLLTRFVKDEDVIGLLSLIESLGREQGVILTTNSLNVVPINKTLESLVIAIKVEGGYTQVHKILALFETLPYQATITNTRIYSTGGGIWEGHFEINITKFVKHET